MFLFNQEIPKRNLINSNRKYSRRVAHSRDFLINLKHDTISTGQ